jgi:hypothetical protein
LFFLLVREFVTPAETIPPEEESRDAQVAK